MTFDDDLALYERITTSWRDAATTDREAMLTQLGRVLDHLDDDDPEYALSVKIRHLMRSIEAGLHVPEPTAV